MTTLTLAAGTGLALGSFINRKGLLKGSQPAIVILFESDESCFVFGRLEQEELVAQPVEGIKFFDRKII